MAGRARTEYEKQILKAIRDLPECDLERIIQWVHCLMDELPDRKTPNGEDLRLFWDSFGSWEDEHSAEEIIGEIRASRKSRTRHVQL